MLLDRDSNYLIGELTNLCKQHPRTRNYYLSLVLEHNNMIQLESNQLLFYDFSDFG